MNILMTMLGVLSMIFIMPSSYAQPESTLLLSSTSISSQQNIPKRYTCEDKNISPELNWKNIPEKTQSLALIVSDPDTPSDTYHWVVYNIPPTVSILTEGSNDIPGMVGNNSFSKKSYNGPCPPKGTTHSYVFTLYALNTLLNLSAGADAKAVLNAIQQHILSQAKLTSRFGR